MMNSSDFKVIASHVSKFDQRLIEVATNLNITLSFHQRHNILLYLDKLLLWNKAYNLTAIKKPEEALVKHIFDCLAIIPHLKTGNLLDIGTGAGLPGIIIAICQPQRCVTVLDSNKKKIRFIKQSSSELKLTNITPIASRIEAFNSQKDQKFEVITSRAFSSLNDFVEVASPFLASDGYLQAMKGLAPKISEIEELLNKWNISTIKLNVPDLEETRHLINLH